MRSIWKFELETVDEQSIEMPFAAEMLDVQVQYGKPCLWALVDPSAKLIRRKIITHGTGHLVPETTGDYIGTYQQENGRLIFHVFETA